MLGTDAKSHSNEGQDQEEEEEEEGDPAMADYIKRKKELKA